METTTNELRDLRERELNMARLCMETLYDDLKYVLKRLRDRELLEAVIDLKVAALRFNYLGDLTTDDEVAYAIDNAFYHVMGCINHNNSIEYKPLLDAISSNLLNVSKLLRACY